MKQPPLASTCAGEAVSAEILAALAIADSRNSVETSRGDAAGAARIFRGYSAKIPRRRRRRRLEGRGEPEVFPLGAVDVAAHGLGAGRRAAAALPPIRLDRQQNAAGQAVLQHDRRVQRDGGGARPRVRLDAENREGLRRPGRGPRELLRALPGAAARPERRRLRPVEPDAPQSQRRAREPLRQRRLRVRPREHGLRGAVRRREFKVARRLVLDRRARREAPDHPSLVLAEGRAPRQTPLHPDGAGPRAGKRG